RFAKAPVGILHRAEPSHSPLAIIPRRQSDSFERAQDSARPVHVIHAPATEPRPFARLILEQKFYSPLDHWMSRRPSVAAKALDDARGHVCRRWIDHRVVIGKRNVAE